MGSARSAGAARTPLFGSYTYHTSTLDLLVRPYNRGNRSPQSMPAKDLFHATVRKALEKDGWVITADPLVLTIGLRSVFIDLGAEKLIAAERGAEKIAVEVKSFIGASPISDLEVAWGQFFLYARALQRQEPDRRLYLAVSETVSQTLFAEEAGLLLLQEPGFQLIVFDPTTEEILQWTP